MAQALIVGFQIAQRIRAAAIRSGLTKCPKYRGKPIIESTYYFGFAFHPIDPVVAVGSYDNYVYVLDISTKKEITKYFAPAGLNSAITYSNDGTLIAFSGKDFIISVTNAKTGNKVKTFTGHSGIVGYLSFSPDGHFLVSLGAGIPFIGGGTNIPSDQIIRVWDVEKGLLYKTIKLNKAICAVSFNKEWTEMVIGEEGGDITIWNIS